MKDAVTVSSSSVEKIDDDKTGRRHVTMKTRGVYVISVAAELCGAHPQTLRGWEAAGLVVPARTAGKARRYSEADLERMQRIIELSNEGIPLRGIARILILEAEVEDLRRRLQSSRGVVRGEAGRAE